MLNVNELAKKIVVGELLTHVLLVEKHQQRHWLRIRFWKQTRKIRRGKHKEEEILESFTFDREPITEMRPS